MAINQESRKELNYEWAAIYYDGNFLRQYDTPNNRENKFADIKQDKLVQFVIERVDNKKSFGVDLQSGLFLMNGKPLKTIEINGEKKSIGKRIPRGTPIKLIYFRRVSRTINAIPANDSLNNIFHFIGWTGIVDGKNEKHEIAISNKTDEILFPPKNSFTPI